MNKKSNLFLWGIFIGLCIMIAVIIIGTICYCNALQQLSKALQEYEKSEELYNWTTLQDYDAKTQNWLGMWKSSLCSVYSLDGISEDEYLLLAYGKENKIIMNEGIDEPLFNNDFSVKSIEFVSQNDKNGAVTDKEVIEKLLTKIYDEDYVELETRAGKWYYENNELEVSYEEAPTANMVFEGEHELFKECYIFEDSNGKIHFIFFHNKEFHYCDIDATEIITVKN